jgi:hypothetical protein
MKQVTKNYYTIDELKESFPEAYRKAIARECSRIVESDSSEWKEPIIDDIRAILACIGFRNIEIQWSGFGNQGDGACFTGTLRLEDINIKALTEYAPNEEVYIKAANDLASVLKDFPRVILTITRDVNCRYYHAAAVDYSLDYEGEVSGRTRALDECKVVGTRVMS